MTYLVISAVILFRITADDSAMFWGVTYFNDMLMEAGPNGNVQSDLLFRKGEDFTLRNGWTFPDRVYFNGDQCVLPLPQDFPTLPNGSPSLSARLSLLLVLVVSAISPFALL